MMIKKKVSQQQNNNNAPPLHDDGDMIDDDDDGGRLLMMRRSPHCAGPGQLASASTRGFCLDNPSFTQTFRTVAPRSDTQTHTDPRSTSSQHPCVRHPARWEYIRKKIQHTTVGSGL